MSKKDGKLIDGSDPLGLERRREIHDKLEDGLELDFDEHSDYLQILLEQYIATEDWYMNQFYGVFANEPTDLEKRYLKKKALLTEKDLKFRMDGLRANYKDLGNIWKEYIAELRLFWDRPENKKNKKKLPLIFEMQAKLF